MAALLIGMGVQAQAGASDTTSEHVRFAAALRHLDAIERLLAEDVTRSTNERARYHFDYSRLAVDLDRVRSGIRDHLSPLRAQPRDLVPIAGDYRQDTASTGPLQQAGSP